MASEIVTAWTQGELENAPHTLAVAEKLESLLKLRPTEDDEEGVIVQEKAAMKAGDIYAMLKRPDELAALLVSVRPFFSFMSKPRAAKLVTRLFDKLAAAGAAVSELQRRCEDMLVWSKQEKLSHLHQRLQLRLAGVYHQGRDATRAIQLINILLRDVRRADDIAMLVEVHLLESNVYHSIRNQSKARAALVAARTSANAIYCPPLQQAEIDMQSGVLCAEEMDFKTGFSYLYEAFEGYHGLGDHSRQAREALRAALLMKVASGSIDELRSLLAAKSVQQYTGDDVDAIKAVADAVKGRDVHRFNAVLAKHGQGGSGALADAFTARHLEHLYEKLLEDHLTRLVAPYRRVQIDFLADAVRLPAREVESRLSQMILDKKLSGIVDQQYMCLVLHEEQHPVDMYREALATIEQLDTLVTALFDKVGGAFDHLAEAKKLESADAKKAGSGGAKAGDKKLPPKKAEKKK